MTKDTQDHITIVARPREDGCSVQIITSLDSVDSTIVAAMIGNMIGRLRFAFAKMVSENTDISPMDAMALMNAVEGIAIERFDRHMQP